MTTKSVINQFDSLINPILCLFFLEKNRFFFISETFSLDTLGKTKAVQFV